MVELVRYIVSELADNKEAVVIIQEEDVIKISVDKADMGKVIGRQGKIAKAIRTIVRAAGLKQDKRYSVDILEAEDLENSKVVEVVEVASVSSVSKDEDAIE